MNRHSFVLSWGRKMFFGFGWPLLCLVGLSYLQSQILPVTPLGIFYFLMTLLGHYGLVTVLLYFILFYPLVRLFPSYYFSRLWLMFLLLGTSLLVFADAILFSVYHLHFNRLILQMIADGAVRELFAFSPSFYILSGVFFFSALIYLWFKGEKIWRRMQRRFSNPNSSWYLILILFCYLVSQGLHIFGDFHGERRIVRHAQSFAFHFPVTAKTLLQKWGLKAQVSAYEDSMGDLHYPLEKLQCPGTEKKNILLVVIDDWFGPRLMEEEYPLLSHYASHGAAFERHLGPAQTAREGAFNLLYSLFGPLEEPVQAAGRSPVFIEELRRRGYRLRAFGESPRPGIFHEGQEFSVSSNVNEEWRIWLESYLSLGESRPFFGYLEFSSPIEADRKVSEVVEGLHAKGLLSETLVVITGSNAESIPSKLEIPLLILWPGIEAQRVSDTTTVFDVVPTLMQELWGCKSDLATFSEGRSLFSPKRRDHLVSGSEDRFQIIDFSAGRVISVDRQEGIKAQDFSGKVQDRKRANSFAIKVLRELGRFRKRGQ